MPYSLVKPSVEAHDGRMGEKPLSIDEAPTTAAGINTTRSNIKNAGGVADAEAGGVAMAGGESAPGIAIKEQGIKYGEGAASAAVGPPTPTPTNPGDPFPGGTSPGGAAAGIDTDGDPIPGFPRGAIAGSNDPIPGVDIIVKKDHRHR